MEAGFRRLAWFIAGAASVIGCDEGRAVPAQMVVVATTDMAVPSEVDRIFFESVRSGQSGYKDSWSIGWGQQKLPGTFVLYTYEDPLEPVTVRMAGQYKGTWRTFREVITPFARDEVRTLYMPLQWLCDGQATQSGGGIANEPSSTCSEKTTCRAGTCQPRELEPSELPEYDPGLVFGGQDEPKDGRCFDTVACMVMGSAVQPDEACTLPNPDSIEGRSVNVALRVAEDGICDSTGTICFVPLDGNNAEGWLVDDATNRIALPQGVCNKLDEGVASAVYVSTACPTMKEQKIPPCGDWSSVPGNAAIAPDAAESESAPLVSVSKLDLPLDDDASLCCPLIQDGDSLYTCICDGTRVVRVFDLGAPSDPVVTDMVSIPIEPGSGAPAPARLTAAVSAEQCLWITETSVGRFDLRTREVLPPLKMTGEDPKFYPEASLLVDDTYRFVLATGIGAQQAVQLVRYGGGTVPEQTWPTGGNKAVLQFDHDESAVYVVRVVDDVQQGERRSSILRIDKRTGADSVLRNSERTAKLQAPNAATGYGGVQVDALALYAIYQSAPEGDGTRVKTEVLRAARSGDGSFGALESVYAQMVNVDPKIEQLTLLGVADGSGLLVLNQHQLGVDGTQSRSTLLALPPALTLDEQPDRLTLSSIESAIPGLAFDETHVYWLNREGTLFALPRAALK